MALADFFDKSLAAPILVVGDLMIDRYIHGAVSRISPEAPVPVIRYSKTTDTIGGAGNVAANVATLGGKGILVSLTGDDEMRARLLKICDKYKLDVASVIASSERRTTTKTRFLCGGQQLMRFDEEDLAPLSEDESRIFSAVFSERLQDAKCVVISDYGKGIFWDDFASVAIKAATAKGLPIIVDPKGVDYQRYQGATAVTPNLKELSEAVGRSIATDEEVASACRELIGRYDFEFVIATRSEKGASVITETHAEHIPTNAREVYDVSGAGDTVVAGVAIGLARGLAPVEAMQVANIAAGIAVGKRGTARILASEVQSKMKRTNAPGLSSELIHDWEETASLVSRWREQGGKIGFTNGCFDILHAGHTSILEAARSRCDRLVVGVNSDASVKRLKGETRPANGQDDRAAVLAALRSVDAVVVFDQDTPLELIKALSPDILFKGKDYTAETVVGAEYVASRGGEVILLDLLEGRSTTAVLAKMSS